MDDAGFLGLGEQGVAAIAGNVTTGALLEGFARLRFTAVAQSVRQARYRAFGCR
jgi:hypothetical protein